MVSGDRYTKWVKTRLCHVRNHELVDAIDRPKS